VTRVLDEIPAYLLSSIRSDIDPNAADPWNDCWPTSAATDGWDAYVEDRTVRIVRPDGTTVEVTHDEIMARSVPAPTW